MGFDRGNPEDLAALQSEVNNDPMGYGYDGDITQAGVLDIINLKRDSITVSLPTLGTNDVVAATYYDAYNNLSLDEQEWLRWITTAGSGSSGQIDVTQDLRDRLTGVLGGSQSGDSIWAAADDDVIEPIMLALIDVDGSRSEELWGQGTVITRDDWIAARDHIA